MEAEHSLDIMQKSAGEMVTKLSDIVWLINPDQDTIHQLFDRLEDYAQQMTAAKSMSIQMEISPSISAHHLPLDARRNIYLFFKEAINNAAKYSEGQRIQIKVEEIGSKIHFSIKDDGKGFDEMTVRKGNGLINMQNRAVEANSIFQIESIPGHGTTIELQYQLNA